MPSSRQQAGESVCGLQNETGHHSQGGGGQPINLSCTPVSGIVPAHPLSLTFSFPLPCGQGNVIDKVVFASFGTPSGSCTAGFKAGACAAPASMEVVSKLCLQQPRCTVVPDSSTFGGDPCEGVAKQLAVQVHCTNTSNASTGE